MITTKQSKNKFTIIDDDVDYDCADVEFSVEFTKKLRGFDLTVCRDPIYKDEEYKTRVKKTCNSCGNEHYKMETRKVLKEDRFWERVYEMDYNIMIELRDKLNEWFPPEVKVKQKKTFTKHDFDSETLARV